MAMNVRLPESLHSEAQAYAGSVGISMNALIAVALRDYLSSRAGQALGARTGVGDQALDAGQPVSPSPAARAQDAPAAAVRSAESYIRGGKRKPCGCGSGKTWRDCHGRQ